MGYDTAHLRGALMRELGLMETVGVAIIGAGHLGQALAGYGGFLQRGFSVTGLYDIDPDKVGRSVHGFPIKHIDSMDEDARSGLFAIAIIATPAEHAPDVLERLGKGRRALDPEFRPGRPAAPVGGRGTQCRPFDRIADPELLPHPSTLNG